MYSLLSLAMWKSRALCVYSKDPAIAQWRLEPGNTPHPSKASVSKVFICHDVPFLMFNCPIHVTFYLRVVFIGTFF